LKAIEGGREILREQGGSAEPGPPARVNDADALMEVAERSLSADPAPRPGAERHQVVIHAGAAGSRIEDGPAICAETARRLACDASVVSIGRKSRVVPAAMRRALDMRDESRCRFPGCENHRWVDAHHIVHWARGGETKLDNLVLLCSRHHRLVHEGGFGLSRKVDGELVFRRPGGEAFPAVPSPAHGSCSELRGRNRGAKLRVVPDSLVSLGRGECYDRGLAVAGLLARAGA
jgi:5-methylcytosine-specific restriction endonuclease McrA